jgi:hypothetical protein
MNIEVTDGICTGRNGTVNISGVNLSTFTDVVRIDCISKKRQKILNAGFSMDSAAARKLAEAIIDLLSSVPTEQNKQ